MAPFMDSYLQQFDDLQIYLQTMQDESCGHGLTVHLNCIWISFSQPDSTSSHMSRPIGFSSTFLLLAKWAFFLLLAYAIKTHHQQSVKAAAG